MSMPSRHARDPQARPLRAEKLTQQTLARFGEALHGVGGVVEGQAVCFILAPGQRVARS